MYLTIYENLKVNGFGLKISREVCLGRPELFASIFLLLFCLFPFQLKAQIENDSIGFYKKLGVRSKKSKLTSWLFDNIVVMQKQAPKNKKHKTSKKVNPFKAFQGKIIRSIEIRVLDPFGLSVNDTSRVAGNRLERYGNNLHITSKEFLVRNQLLFEKFDSLDMLRLSESERILRQSPYISDARIYVKSSAQSQKKSSDSVDIAVWIQDQWTLLPESGFEPAYPNILLKDRNFAGLGVNFRQEIGYKFSNQQIFLQGQYGLFNFRKTFLSGYFNYQISDEKSSVGIAFDRPFFSPLARWAGGLQVNRTFTRFFPYLDSEKTSRSFPIDYNLIDGWLGRSWQLQKGKSVEKQSTSIIAGFRISALKYTRRPGIESDTFYQNANQILTLATIGLARREFYKEKYLYRFGANEDVPTGYAFQFITGHLNREFGEIQYYLGLSASGGILIENKGYFAAQLAYGNFFNKSNVNTGLVRANVNYFSNLAQYGRWSLRQFVSLSSIFGIDQAAYNFINLNGSQLYGFNSSSVRGKSKAILNLETVLYMPYNIFGFRLAPVLFLGLGKIGNNMESLLNSKIYQAISIGLLVRNENLVLKTFELSIGFYPYISGGDWYRLLPISSYKLKVRDFALPKPEVLVFE